MPATIRRLARALPLALTLVAVAAPAAHAWHGTLVVKAVNTGGDPADAFSYSVKSAPAGTTLTGGAFTLTGGQSKTLTNIASGGEGGASSWKAFVVAQTDDPRYDTSVACAIDPVWDGLGKDGSVWAPAYSAAGGEHRATVELRWWNNLAYTTTCTVTNTRKAPPATLTVTKRFIGAPANASVDLSVDGAVRRSGATDGAGTGAVTVAAGTHTFGEAAPGGGPLEGTAETTCFDGNGASVPATAGTGGRTWSVEVAGGAQVACTITNLHVGTITITKVTDPPPDDDGPPKFSFSSPLDRFFTLSHGQRWEKTASPGSYTFSEQTRTGSELVSIACDDAAQAAGASVVNLAARSVAINLQPGEHVTCTFTNHVESEIVATARPRTLSAAAAVKGATLHGSTAACVDDVAIAEVRGKKVKRVMFYLDGRKVRYLHRTGKGRFTLRQSVAKLAPGKHRIRANVRFTRRSGLPIAAMKLEFTRCS